jgi:hypothetical protein
MQEERTRERFSHMTLLLNLSLVFNAVIIKHSNILDIKELYLSVQGVISSVPASQSFSEGFPGLSTNQIFEIRFFFDF